MLDRIDREIVGDLYFSSRGLEFVEELVDRFGPRFHGSPQEHAAAAFLRERFERLGPDRVETETFACPGWTRGETQLAVTSPVERAIPSIALPYSPPATVEGPLVDVGPGDPSTFDARRTAMRGAVVMASTAIPRNTRVRMNLLEKVGRAFEAGAVGFIWMRGVPGGLPEAGPVRLGFAAEAPAVAVSYERGYELQRLAAGGPVRLRITSANENRVVTSHNLVAEFRGTRWPEEVVVLGAHYDAHDIGQGAMDNGAGLSVLMEVARTLRAYRGEFRRTLRFVAFSGEETGLHGSRHHAERHRAEAIRFMLNLDGSARSLSATIHLPAWPEGLAFLRGLYDGDVVDDPYEASLWLHSDHYSFTAQGFPGAIVMSDQPPGASAGAVRGFGHTPMDTLDKVSGRAIEMEASRVARLALRLVTVDEIPMRRKTPREIADVLTARELDRVLRYERRALPGEPPASGAGGARG